MAAFGIGFPFDISGSPKIGGDSGPALSSARVGPVQVGGLNAPAYPFAAMPGGVNQRDLIWLAAGVAAVVLLTRSRRSRR